MKKKYIILYDEIINKFILWENHRNYMIEITRGYKWECIKRMNKLNG